MNDKKQLARRVLMALLELNATVQRAHLPRHGICQGGWAVLVYEGGVSYPEYLAAIKEAFKTWPEYSGDEDYPVRSTHWNPKRAYDETFSLWDRESLYGQARRRLLAHMIEHFTALVE